VKEEDVAVFCPRHYTELVYVTRTGWCVVQCRRCGLGDIVLPPGEQCGCRECNEPGAIPLFGAP